MGDRGRLTNAGINEKQLYYDLAIRRNVNSLFNIQQAVWAEFYHLSSTNKNPNHRLCPEPPDTWCKFKKALANNEVYDHDNHTHIPKAVMDLIRPIFVDLAKDELLKRCLHGGTQNACESVNSVIWSRVPKTTFMLRKSIEFRVYEGIASFNIGNRVKCRILTGLGIKPGINCIRAMEKKDNTRVKEAEKAIEEVHKKYRQQQNLAKRQLKDREEEDPENPSYGAGMF